ncbi:putative nucleotidyltransferase with HDIG domain [Orenia metallireducens]|uniref:HDIG domain-containing protein n=1 Tax=Orenia metallireducens TaxID=1413210 RepID=A0A285I6M5_9FIRM|nr:HD-GYP domain-containing protein [Orenia metallireducens]PRX23143.1 putative nucleotidyltransferase with HDIG domain [Orenia metallireducens]SNY42601.1 HDIG domain-containing protein [Orenia metallireducens]
MSVKYKDDLKDKLRLHLDNLKQALKGTNQEYNKSQIFQLGIDKKELRGTTLEKRIHNYNKISQQVENLIDDFGNHNELEIKFKDRIVLITSIGLELYDDYTRSHSENVAKLAKKIAIELGLSQQDLAKTYYAGLLHDIGKILIPNEILNKPDRLTDREYQIIKKHPVLGYRISNKYPELKEIARLILYHHERWNGKGYPQGLVGDEIPLISQVLAVADAWDAMTSKRPYHNPLSKELALKEIKDNRGSQFAPKVVDTFLMIFCS